MENITDSIYKRYWITMILHGLGVAFGVPTLEEAHNVVANASEYIIADLDTGKIIEIKN
jgi:hypothetical protein